MERRRFGKTGLDVSVLGFGGAPVVKSGRFCDTAATFGAPPTGRGRRKSVEGFHAAP